MNKELSEQLSNFEEAFTLNSSSCRDTCKCGREFYDNWNSWDWEEGEFEALQNNPNATAVDYAVQRLEIGGDYFVRHCDCWHETAEKYINVFYNYKRQIASFFALEKARKLSESEAIPVIEVEE